MRLGLDARILAHPQRGIQTYLVNLIEHFVQVSGLEIFLFGDKPLLKEYLGICGQAETIIFGQRHRKYWAQFQLPRELKKYKIDIYHAVWNSALPVFAPCPSVVTIHDLIPWNVPGYFTKFKKKIKYKCQELLAASKAKAIITNSEYSKGDIIKHLRVPEQKVKVIYYGLESIFKQEIAFEAIRQCQDNYGLPRDYIIIGGGFIEPRRNTETLIKAFHLFLTRSKLDVQLVLVGSADDARPQYLRLKELIGQLQLGQRIKFVGHLPKQEQFLLLAGAKMMILASVYEGFGLPLIEAMACGVPVVASKVTSIPEVVQDAGLLVNPHSPQAIAAAIEKVYTDSQLRSKLIGTGLSRAQAFSWERAAEQTLSVYQELLNNE